ncbi:U6 snRNA phosphodiesterase 1-like [Paramacrobiotus metropolitanus]|uniref:U6 snRNA phosphodiesterase 1-like n=1 Tax=Paramacrobiotus metropolitanus TaxID=2943436 RepID=UPI002445C072|nr:U6 snRNA phosphodiesterase 1-like [Paramacrobiotus metropolitanus]
MSLRSAVSLALYFFLNNLIMAMVAKVRYILQKWLDDNGTSEFNEEKSEKGSKASFGVRKTLVSSKRKRTPSKQKSVFDKHSHFSGSNVHVPCNKEEFPKTERGESISNGRNRNALTRFEHPTDETPSLDSSMADPASDDTDMDYNHDQRIRAYPHFAGNRAMFVYMISPVEGLSPLFAQLLAEVLKIPDIKHHNWSMIDEPHISLSRIGMLRYHEIPQFTAHLKTEIKKSSVPRFSYSFEDVEIYCNEQANTSFLALRVGRGSKEMGGLVKIVDSCLKSFNMPQYYEKPDFHLSFAWCPEQLDELDKQKLLVTVRKRLQRLSCQFAEGFEQCAKAVRCRSGNRSYLVAL